MTVASGVRQRWPVHGLWRARALPPPWRAARNVAGERFSAASAARADPSWPGASWVSVCGREP